MTPRHESNDAWSNGEAVYPTIGVHPLGIKPLGNAYTAQENLKLNAGLFACLPDEVLIQFLEHLSASLLRSIGATCKALYAFSRVDELWKSLLIE